MARKQARARAVNKPSLPGLETAVPEERQPLEQFAEKAYLDYAMAVILDRALPYLADGLKPVQRRILYAMHELHLHAGAKHKKSVRTVGDALSKYHPHSDVACYEAMVMLAQDFSCRYPLVDGQGNWGSIDDPKSFAAMRYTEARLRPYASLLLAELGQGAVDWVPNFDGSLQEPVLLPAQVPNILLNGASGIAVGMATDIPPHNIFEVLQACLYLLDNRKATLAELMQHLPGPDFPTGGEIISSRADIKAIYESGAGVLRQRAVYGKQGKHIVITELPYQISLHKVRQQINTQIESRKLTLLADTRDESDDEQPVRLVLVPASGKIDCDALMAHLFATTDLESSRRVRFTIIDNHGLPQTMPLLRLLQQWLEFRLATVSRRLQYRVQEIQQRLHLLAALRAVYANLQKVIKIIRESEQPQAELMQELSLDEDQVKAILALPLRRLARLEEQKMMAEISDLQKELKRLQTTLSSKARLRTVVKKELQSVLKQYGDQRRTKIVGNAMVAKAIDTTTTVAVEDITVSLSCRGWLCARRGHEHNPEEHGYRQDDGLLQAVRCRNNDTLVLLDMRGRCYGLPAARVPGGRGTGSPASSLFNPPDGTEFRGCMSGSADALCLLASSDGYGFIASVADLVTRQKTGKEVLRCATRQVTALTPVCLLPDYKNSRLAVLTDSGRLLLFPVSELPQRRAGRGVKLMALTAAETVLSVCICGEGESLKLWRGQDSSKLTESKLEQYNGARARRGRVLSPRLRKSQLISAGEQSPYIFQ